MIVFATKLEVEHQSEQISLKNSGIFFFCVHEKWGRDFTLPFSSRTIRTNSKKLYQLRVHQLKVIASNVFFHLSISNAFKNKKPCLLFTMQSHTHVACHIFDSNVTWNKASKHICNDEYFMKAGTLNVLGWNFINERNSFTLIFYSYFFIARNFCFHISQHNDRCVALYWYSIRIWYFRDITHFFIRWLPRFQHCMLYGE